MSKKSKKRRKNPPLTAKDTHHLLWLKKQDWSKGYAHALCMAFTRYIPVVYHRELHSKISHIPVPDGELCRKAWMEYQRNKDEIDSYDVARAAAWLYVNIPDEEFRKAMQFQVDFFAQRYDRLV